MKKSFLAIGLLAIIACNKKIEEPVNYAIFSGTITNKNDDKLTVFGEDFKKEIKVNEDGTFKDTLRLKNDGIYTYRISPEQTTFYLKSGDNISLTIDTKQFDETIQYKGIGAERNNYKAKIFLLNETIEESFKLIPEEFFKLIPEEFLNKINAHKNEISELLKEVKETDSTFLEMATKENHYEYLSALQRYPFNHQEINKLDSIPSLPKDFFKELNEISLDNEIDFLKFDSYRNIVISNIYTETTKAVDQDTTKTFHQEFLNNVKELKSPEIRNELIGILSLQFNANTPHIEEIYKDMMALSTDEKFKTEMTSSFEKMMKLGKGKPSPLFENYENIKGGTTSLSDFKGKYVYIDVWATWCQPCLREIPALKEIEKEYHGKNIEFVSISVDRNKAHDTWKKMIAQKKLSGVQLFADKSFRSEFVFEYAINAIPRFILIDPNGNIISSDAPRPSSSNLKEMFGSLKI